MGKATGFLEFERRNEAYEAPLARVKHYKEFVHALSRRRREDPGRALHGLRHSVLQQRLPGEQHHSGLQRPGFPAELEDRDRGPAFDQQLPRVHRAASARRRAKRPARSASTTIRSASSRSSTRSSTKPGPKAGSRRSRRSTRPARRWPSSDRGLPGLAAAQQLARAGHDVTRVREERSHRRIAALRHPRFQARKVADRPPHAADGSRGRDVPHQRVHRQGSAAGAYRQHGEGNRHAG